MIIINIIIAIFANVSFTSEEKKRIERKARKLERVDKSIGLVDADVNLCYFDLYLCRLCESDDGGTTTARQLKWIDGSMHPKGHNVSSN